MPTIAETLNRGPVRRQAPQSVLQKHLDPRIVERGGVLPFGRTASGARSWAWPEAALSLVRSLMLPGHVARGGAYTPDDVTAMALDVGMLGAAGTAPAGALAMGAGRKGPKLSAEEYSKIQKSNSKARRKWGGDLKQKYRGVTAAQAERGRRFGGDRLLAAKANRPYKLKALKAQRRALESDPSGLWSKAFVDEIKRAGGYVDAGHINRANLEAVPRQLAKESWVVRHGSTSKGGRKSSRYLVSPDGLMEVRLSDHFLPDTAQRAYSQQNMGTRWDDEIILSGNEGPHEIIAEIKRLYMDFAR